MQIIKSKLNKKIKDNNTELENFNKQVKDLNCAQINEMIENLETELTNKILAKESIVLSHLQSPYYNTITTSLFTIPVILDTFFSYPYMQYFYNTKVANIISCSIFFGGFFAVTVTPFIAKILSNHKCNKVLKTNQLTLDKLEILKNKQADVSLEK